jgi:actin-like ATPase involved in cell morphogenesis
MKFKVGQVIFLLAKDSKVYPARITEEINRKTLDGTSVSYTVMLPDSNSTQVSLDKIEANVFETSELLKNHMMEKARESIDNIVENANSLLNRLGVDKESIDAQAIEDIEKTVTVSLDDGTKARVDMSGIE